MPAHTHPETPDYGTWVRTRPFVVFGGLTGLSLAALLLVFLSPWALLALLPAAAFGWIFLILGLARWRCSDRGGRYQARIHDLIVSRAKGQRVFDIGCGNGHLAIQLARRELSRTVTGLDFWGSAWEYSKETCERNARIEGVADRVVFLRGSAASLPFADGEFDCVVSSMTFHEVRDLADKTLAIPEALRVLRPGGTFVFLDLFSDPGKYPHEHLLYERLEAAGATVDEDRLLSTLVPLPFPLNGKQLMKHARVVAGTKR